MDGVKGDGVVENWGIGYQAVLAALSKISTIGQIIREVVSQRYLIKINIWQWIEGVYLGMSM